MAEASGRPLASGPGAPRVAAGHAPLIAQVKPVSGASATAAYQLIMSFALLLTKREKTYVRK